MDNNSIINSIVKFFVAVLFVALIFCVTIFTFDTAVAYASDITVSVSATYEKFNFATFQYEKINYDLQNPNYGKNITVNFDVTGTPSYYYFGIQVDDGLPFVDDANPLTFENKTISYKVAVSGTVKVTLYLTDADKTVVHTDAVVLKSDIESPNQFANVNVMDNWIGNASYVKTFYVFADLLNSGDELSGRGPAYYSFADEDGSILINKKLVENDTINFTINKNGKLTVYYFDNADNYIEKTYLFDKFDFIKPIAPTINCTAESDLAITGNYSKKYKVTIDYHTDLQSGIGENQTYTYNGETFRYNGAFYVSGEKDHFISAYAVDKAGNGSEKTEKSLSREEFDNYPPSINNIKIFIDAKNADFITINATIYDAKSGVDRVILKKGDYSQTMIYTGINNVYQAKFQGYGLSGVEIHAYDKVGNESIDRRAILYFSDENFSDKINGYIVKYLTTDFDTYNTAVAKEISNYYDILSRYLMVDTQNSDFDSLFQKIDTAFNTRINYNYIIDDVPKYWSTVIKFTINEDDLVNAKFGDTVTLKIGSAVGTLDGYLEKACFAQGFVDYLKFSFYINGELIESLPSGITVEMNLPLGYYERSYKLFETSSGQGIDLQPPYYNGGYTKTTFKISGSGEYALVISGTQEKVEAKAPDAVKTIKVFGKNMKLATFLWVVIGTSGGLVIAVVVIIIAKRKKG